MQQTEKQRAAAKAAAERAAEAKKEAEAALASEHASFFSFGDVSWIATRLEKQADLSSGLGVIDIKPIVEGWLQLRFPNRLATPRMDRNALQEAISRSGIDTDQPIDFLELLKLVHVYTEVHLEHDPKAGFSKLAYDGIKAKFDPYDKSGDGLKTRELWECLSDCGIIMSGQDDQHWMIHMVKKVDMDENGLIDVGEFCQLLRKVRFRMDTENNAREFRLITKSKIPVKEVEEWAALFRLHDVNHQNSLTLAQLHKALAQIGIKWGNAGTEILLSWMKEEDENANHLLDFGEFCCLIARMIAEDFQGIRTNTSKAAGAVGESTTPQEKPRWTSEKRIKLAFDGDADAVPEPLSPTFAPRASMEFDGNWASMGFGGPAGA